MPHGDRTFALYRGGLRDCDLHHFTSLSTASRDLSSTIVSSSVKSSGGCPQCGHVRGDNQHPPKESRSERLTLRMTKSLKRAVEDLADRDNRSVSDWICLRLAEVVRAESVHAETAAKKR